MPRLLTRSLHSTRSIQPRRWNSRATNSESQDKIVDSVFGTLLAGIVLMAILDLIYVPSGPGRMG